MPDATTVQLMCAILPGLMSRYGQPGYSDSYAISEAFVLARDFLCEQRKISSDGAVANGEQLAQPAIFCSCSKPDPEPDIDLSAMCCGTCGYEIRKKQQAGAQ